MPGFELALPDSRSPSISTPWTVSAMRPLAAATGDGATADTYCSASDQMNNAIQKNTRPFRLRAVNPNDVPRDDM